jgi:hypothetical protein
LDALHDLRVRECRLQGLLAPRAGLSALGSWPGPSTIGVIFGLHVVDALLGRQLRRPALGKHEDALALPDERRELRRVHALELAARDAGELLD